MSTVRLSGWKEDLDRAVPVLPYQREAILRAYRLAVTTGGKRVGDLTGIASYINANATGTGGRAVVSQFLPVFERRARAGTVPMGEYDPSQSALAVIGRGVAEGSKIATGGLTRIAIIAVVGLVGYLVVTGQLRLPKPRD